MKIGIASPVELQMLLDYLYVDDKKKMQSILGLGGGGTQPTQMAIQFIKMGYRVSVFTLSQNVFPGTYEIFNGKNLTIYVGHLRRGKKVVFDFQYKEIMLVKKMIQQDRPDVLSCHWTYEFSMAGILSETPTMITVRDWSPAILKLTKKPYRFMRMLMSFVVFLCGKKFIPNSPYIEGKLKFLKDKKLDVIPNGIDDSLLLRDAKVFSSPSELKIISINNGFGDRKNLKPLIISFSKILKDYSGIKLYLIGDGFGVNEEAYAWCHENKLLAHIEFIGKINYDEVIKFLDGSDLMVHPAKEESFGNILVEAMARRVPLIAGENSGAVPWVVGESGVLIDINDEGVMYKSILNFINNTEQLKSYSKKGYENVCNRFRLSKIALQYIENFKKINE